MQHPEVSNSGEPVCTSAQEEQGGELFGEGCPGSLRLGSQVSTANWGWEPGAEIPDLTAAPFPVSCHCSHLVTSIWMPGTARKPSDTVCAGQPRAQSPSRGRAWHGQTEHTWALTPTPTRWKPNLARGACCRRDPAC